MAKSEAEKKLSLPRFADWAVRGLVAGLTKGIGFGNIRAFVGTRFGQGVFDTLLTDMTEEDQQALAGIVPVGWYDLALYARLIRTLDRQFGKNDLSLLNQLSHFEAAQDLTTIHRLFMRVANPGLILDKTTQLWRRFHDTGDWSVAHESHSATGTLRGWGVVDEALCVELTGYIQGIIEVGTGKEVKVRHTQCRANGDTACVFAGRWR